MQGKNWLASCVCALTLLGTAASAQAATSVYPTDPAAISLNQGDAGWTSSTSSEGLCVPVVLCPAISNSIQSSGGPGGSGYLNTELGSLLGVGATSIGTFTGPTFTYDGVDGRRPDRVILRLTRRADVAALLAVAGNDATYSVMLEDQTSGPDLQVVNEASLSGSPQFSQVPAVEIEPSQLVVGHDYRIAINSRFESGVQVVTGSSADYAKVRITAKRRQAGTGNNGNDGADGADGAGGTIGNTVKLKGKYLVAKVKCSKQAPKRKCKSRLNARLSKRGQKVTATQTARVKAGRKAKVRLRIQGKYRKKVAGLERITIQRKTRVAGKVKTTYKSAKIKG